jgi:hypothetical protein
MPESPIIEMECILVHTSTDDFLNALHYMLLRMQEELASEGRDTAAEEVRRAADRLANVL